MADALDHYLTWRLYRAELDIELDFADAQLDEPALTANAPRLEAALDALHRIEGGAVANADEGRMVGHYWLRDPERAPDPAIAQAIHDSGGRSRPSPTACAAARSSPTTVGRSPAPSSSGSAAALSARSCSRPP
ncbi:hypothetical protein OV079_15385 [Nannocystis pusilla]|uniref:Glucose-6-phosphate isomerase n=1 Tax=Nannocystis pusilla TaxID=889268 RepID=A0A9X3IYJ0_9BACT|nr:hypothetical protein [Nannocystis pusilla]